MKKAACLYFVSCTLLFFVPVIKCYAQNPRAVDSLQKEIRTHAIKDSSLVRTFLNYAQSISFENTDSAMKYTDDALQLSQMLKWQRGIASALNQKGFVYYYKSDLVSAMNYFQQALQAGESLHNQLFEANVYGNIANIYADLGQSEKALGFYNKQLDISREIKDKKFETVALVNIGDIYMDENDYQKGFTYFRKGLIAAQNVNNLNAVAACFLNMGILFKKEKQFDSAQTYLEEAIDMSKRLNSKNTEASALTQLAEVSMSLNDYNKAEEYLLQSLTLAKEISDVEWQRDAYKTLSSAYEKENKSGKALTAYKNYMTLYDSMMNDKKKGEITRMEIQFEFDKKAAVAKVINDKQQAIAKAEIQKQRFIENATMAGTGFLILAGIGSFLFYRRNRNIKTQKNEAELKLQITDTEMKALRAQMNPHFIFNSLSSIADYINNNQTKMASDFTARFAMLMRMVLENSEHKEIPLADDLQALELYMQLESFRYQNKFDYHVEVDETIDPENTLVPPLILQPLIENSIKHGLAGKKGKGHLTIRIQQAGNMLNCIVEDDGEGIKETTDTAERKSMGMKITRARIEIINKLKNAGASMNVSNKKQGVRAEVILPLELSF